MADPERYTDEDIRQSKIREDLSEWWSEQARREIEAVVPKAIEYGAADLEVMGQAMQALIPAHVRESLSLDAARLLGLEMAVAFYALGKVARLFGAYERGQAASGDTWHDLGVYTRMAQHIRDRGKWV